MAELVSIKNKLSKCILLLLLLSVIYLSLDKVHEALDAYKKAHALEPNNDNYKQSIRICEERLSGASEGAATAGVCICINFDYIFKLTFV